MSQVVKELKARQGDLRTEEYATKMGIPSATLFAYFREERNIGVNNARKMAKYFHERGDQRMILILGAYVLGVDVPSQS